MIERYTLPRMGAVWTRTRKYETWLQVELAVCEAREERGEVPGGVARRVKRKVALSILTGLRKSNGLPNMT